MRFRGHGSIGSHIQKTNTPLGLDMGTWSLGDKGDMGTLGLGDMGGTWGDGDLHLQG